MMDNGCLTWMEVVLGIGKSHIYFQIRVMLMFAFYCFPPLNIMLTGTVINGREN